MTSSERQTRLETRKARPSFGQSLSRFFERGWFAPFLLAVQPLLHLFSINDTEVYFSQTLRSLWAALLLAAVVLGLTYLLLRDRQRANPVASLFMFLFFAFGDLSDWVVNTFGLGPVRADLLVLAFVGAVLLLWAWLVQRRIRNIALVNLYFSLLSVLFLLKSGIPVASHVLENGISPNQNPPAPVTAAASAEPRPDIYYIILDGYGRQDILQALYDFDNSDFLDALRARGFYVAEESSSNYMQTLLSMTSALNMEYIQSLKGDGTSFEYREAMFGYFQNSKVRSIFAQNGYEMVAFGNAYAASVSNAEIYYDDAGRGYITAFESLAIDRTLARILVHIPAFNKVLIEIPYDTHRSQILSTFARLQELPAREGDYFVYAHIIAPHPPFVFDENGEALPQDKPFGLGDGNHYIKRYSQRSYIQGYRRQIQYVNTRVLETVDAILSRSETRPIIIIQGDHGPGSRLHMGTLNKTLPAERFSILNAYYFPDQDYTSLYPSISPVNSFRVLLNQFFDGSYALVPDHYYYSTWGYPFDFIEITDFSLPQ